MSNRKTSDSRDQLENAIALSVSARRPGAGSDGIADGIAKLKLELSSRQAYENEVGDGITILEKEL
jgi:hypothetical protein